MKMVQVAPFFHPHVGGVESHVLELAKKVKEHGHEVSVVTSQLEGMDKEEVVQGIQVHRIKTLSERYSTPITTGLKDMLEHLDPELMHSHSPPPITSYHAAKACKTLGIPSVFTYHCDLQLTSLMGKAVVSFYRRTFSRKTLALSDKIIVTSKTYGATSRDIWKYDPAIIPNAVDAETFNPKVDPGYLKEKLVGKEKMVLSVGRLVHHKGIEHLVKAMTMVKDAKLVVVGTGPMLPPLRKLANQLGLHNRVIFAGNVPNEELPKYYRASDLFVLPSISRLEAFGIVLLEAMASGKPVVASRIPGVREVIEDGKEGFLCTPVDPTDISVKVNTLLTNQKLMEEMGRKGRKRVEENFRWNIVYDSIEKVYQDVLAAR